MELVQIVSASCHNTTAMAATYSFGSTSPVKAMPLKVLFDNIRKGLSMEMDVFGK